MDLALSWGPWRPELDFLSAVVFCGAGWCLPLPLAVSSVSTVASSLSPAPGMTAPLPGGISGCV